MQTQMIEVGKEFSTKRAALDYMQYIEADQMVLRRQGNGYLVIYPVARSTIDGESVPIPQGEPITS